MLLHLYSHRIIILQVVDGKFNLTLDVNEIYTLTTLSTGHKGHYQDPPPSAPFPTNYEDDFECKLHKIHVVCNHGCLNSLEPSDAIWCWRSWSTLVQVMACCLTAPSHYLNQCWLIISKVPWHSSEDIVIRRFEVINQYNKIEDYIFKITLRSPRGQWVNTFMGLIASGIRKLPFQQNVIQFLR